MKLRITKITNKNGGWFYSLESKHTFSGTEIFLVIILSIFFPRILWANRWENEGDYLTLEAAETRAEKLIQEETIRIEKEKLEDEIKEGKEKIKSETIKNYVIK